jgi:cob(I)alamin adenosyltransferase
MTDEAAAEIPLESPVRPELRRAPSLVIVNTGDGKGKSSSAFGVMLRSVARGWKVAVIQYLKSGKWNTGEEKVGVQLGVDWWAIGDGFTWDSKDLDGTEAISREAWAASKARIQAGEHQLVILDEITYPMNWGWISTDDVVATIANRPTHVNVICTGRNAPQALIDIADTVTEMVKVKHAFEAGISAKRGIEY